LRGSRQEEGAGMAIIAAQQVPEYVTGAAKSLANAASAGPSAL